MHEMNYFAEELGLNSTTYSNPHGLSNPNNYSTARDVGLLAAYAVQNPYFCEIVETANYSCYINN